MAQQLQPDLILLDIGLPVLNGMDASRRIRRISPQPKILIEGKIRAGDVEAKALRPGAGGYIEKPSQKSALLPGSLPFPKHKPFVSTILPAPAIVNKPCLHVASA